MIARRAGALAAVVAAAAGFAVAAAGPAVAAIVPVAGYVWADQQSAASYTPSSFYSYNSAGQTNTITRSAVGTYQVDFAGLPASSRGGTVDVSAYNYGSKVAFCKTTGWGSDGSGGTTVGVACFTPNGRQLRDSRFTAMFTVTPPDTRVAYAWADQPTAASYNPSSYYSYNGFGGPILITRQSYGQYTVLVRNAASLLGAVKVTAYGGDAIACHPRYWVPQQSAMKILVDCNTPDGVPADSRFDITWTPDNNLTGRADLTSAYASAPFPYTTDYTPEEQFRTNREDGRAITVHRADVGTYVVRIPNQATSGGHVQLNAFNDIHTCEAFRWLPAGTDEQIQVRCYDDTGALVDTTFALQWVIGV